MSRKADPHEDLASFREAVGEVAPVKAPARAQHARPKPPPIPVQQLLDDHQVLVDSLSNHDPATLDVETGEELLFLRDGLDRSVLRKLRRGQWVVQAELDLHGHNQVEARIELVQFMNYALKHGLRCVRIVHGKGNGSPGREPVLKHKVRTWLVQKSEVMAFAQASAADGGHGAVLVLLG